MTDFKLYRNRETGEEVWAFLREDGVFEVKDKNCPVQKLLGFTAIVGTDNFNKNFSEIKQNENN